MNAKGYLTDNHGNIVSKSGKVIIPHKFLNPTGEMPKVFREMLFKGEDDGPGKSVTEQLREEISGNFRDKNSIDVDENGLCRDDEGRTCNQDGYLMDAHGNVVDNKGRVIFAAAVLDHEAKKAKMGFGTIPRIFQKKWIRKQKMERIAEEDEESSEIDDLKHDKQSKLDHLLREIENEDVIHEQER